MGALIRISPIHRAGAQTHSYGTQRDLMVRHLFSLKPALSSEAAGWRYLSERENERRPQAKVFANQFGAEGFISK